MATNRWQQRATSGTLPSFMGTRPRTAVGAGAAPTMTTVGSLAGGGPRIPANPPLPQPGQVSTNPDFGMSGIPANPALPSPGQVSTSPAFGAPSTNAANTFGPGNDSRFTVIPGTPSAATQGYGSQLQTAVGQLPTSARNVLGDPRVVGAQGQSDAARNAVANAPDRLALVKGMLEDYDTENAGALARQFRQVGQLSTALGRNGSGMTDQDIGDVATNYQRNRMLFGNSAIRDAVSGTMNDRLNQLGALSGEESRIANELRQERGYADDLAFARVGTLSGVYGQQAGLDRVGRDEARGERDYQVETADRARREQIEALLLGEQLYGSEFNRNLALAGMGDPGALAGYFQGAGAASAGAASNYYAGAGGLLGSYLARRNNPATN